MTDDVNNPSHYNKQGIEVIDVIEAYATDFRLANVLKYVCRCEYKGTKLQDLEKAAWYLNRTIQDLYATADCAEWEADPANADWTGIDRGVSDWTLDDIEVRPVTPEDLELALTALRLNKLRDTPEECLPVDEWRTKDGGFSPDEMVEMALEDESWMNDPYIHWPDGWSTAAPKAQHDNFAAAQELSRLDPIVTFGDTAPEPMFQEFDFHAPADRIAGDDAAATRVKDEYYDYKRFEIQGYCANCDAEIALGQPYVRGTSDGFDKGLMFCKLKCVRSLQAWQKDWKL
jgi:hypothetical protein